MADRKITDLTALAAGSQATGDLLTIVDVSEAAATDKNKKITVESLFKGIPGDVGIATSSPSFKLSVAGGGISAQTSANDGALVFLPLGGSTENRIYSRSSVTGTGNKDLAFRIGDTERLRINSSGNVGIGTSSPSELLHTVKASGTSRVRFEASASHSFARLIAGSTSYNSGVEFFSGTTNTANITAQGGGELVVEANGSERMRIDSSGNVGIGTTSPACGLHIDNPSNAAITQILDTDNQAVKLVFRNNTETGNNVQIGADGSALVALTNATERMRIDSSGDLKFNSGFGSVGTAYGCRAWVNFNGTGTVAIRDSGNVSSITDNGTGNYTIAFTTAMPDANYCVVTTSSYATGVTESMFTTVNGDALFTTGGFNAKSRDDGGTLRDVNYFFAAVFR